MKRQEMAFGKLLSPYMLFGLLAIGYKHLDSDQPPHDLPSKACRSYDVMLFLRTSDRNEG
jgi:hypothetical protein